MVYKPTNISGGPHPVGMQSLFLLGPSGGTSFPRSKPTEAAACGCHSYPLAALERGWSLEFVGGSWWRWRSYDACNEWAVGSIESRDNIFNNPHQSINHSRWVVLFWKTHVRNCTANHLKRKSVLWEFWKVNSNVSRHRNGLTHWWSLMPLRLSFYSWCNEHTRHFCRFVSFHLSNVQELWVATTQRVRREKTRFSHMLWIPTSHWEKSWSSARKYHRPPRWSVRYSHKHMNCQIVIPFHLLVHVEVSIVMGVPPVLIHF